MWYRGKLIACLLVGLLFATSFVFVPTSVEATIESGPDERGIYIYQESLDSQTIYPGDREVSFYLRIRNGDNDLYDDDEPIRNCNVSIGDTVRDVNGQTIQSPIDTWLTWEVKSNATLWEGGSFYTFSGFEFNVKPDAPAQIYNLTVRMVYNTVNNARGTFVGFIHFDIRLRADVDDIYDLNPGDKKRGITVHVDVFSYLTDPTLELTAPTGFTWFGSTTQTITASRTGTSYNDWYVPFTISVNDGMALMVDGYIGTYRLEYENLDGLFIIEMGEVAFHVNALPMLTATMDVGDFLQGTTTTTWSVTVRNTGNVDMIEGKVWIDQVSSAFVYTAADHYEGYNTVSYSKIDITDLRVHEATTVDFPVVVDTFIPEGEHKILMDFSCYFYDPIDKVYRSVYTWWINGPDGYYPVVSIDSSNVYLSPTSTTVEGMYGNLQVVDEVIEVRVQSSTVLDLGGQLIDNWMHIYVENYGNVDYINPAIRLETNTEESPFLNPIYPESLFSEEIIMSSALYSGGTYSVAVPLTIRPGTDPGVYMVPVLMTGINSDTGMVIHTELEARITLRGLGPQLKVTDVSPKEVTPGEDFTLELTVTNEGDDTAWSAILSVPPTFTLKDGFPSGVEDAVSTPEPEVLPMHLGDIGPGQGMVIEIPMRCSDGTEGGQIYPFYFTINCTDSYGFHPRGDSLNYEVAIKTESTMADSPWMTVIIIVVIGLLVVFALVAVRWRGGGPKPPEPMREAPPVAMETVPPKVDGPTVEQFGKEKQPPPVIAEVPKRDLPPPPKDKKLPPALKKGSKNKIGLASGAPLGAPGFLDGRFENGKISINWRKPITEEPSNVKGYRVLRWGTGSDIAQIAEVVDGLEYVDSDIEVGIAYNYAVQAFNDSGQSEASNWIEIATM
jgi:hypothetical protein